MDKQKQQAIIEGYISAFNSFDLKGMLENFDNGVTFKNTENGLVTLTTNGIEEFEQISKKAMEFFSQRKLEVLEYDFVDSTVVVYYKFEAVLKEDLTDKLKKGDDFSIGGKSVFTFDHEKVISLEDYS